MNLRLFFATTFLLVLATVTGGLLLQGQSPQHMVPAPQVNPQVIAPGIPAVVIVSVHIDDPALVGSGLNVLRISADGSQTIIGTLHDDGTNGDAVSGDKTFAGRIGFSEPLSTQVPLALSGAFRGQLARIISKTTNLMVRSTAQSSTTTINVSGGLISVSPGFNFSVPPGSLARPVPFTISTYDRNKLPASIPLTLPVYADVEVTPGIDDPNNPPATDSYTSNLTVPLLTQLAAGTSLTVLEYKTLGQTLAPTGDLAIVGPDGTTASFRTTEVGLFILVKASERGIENVQ